MTPLAIALIVLVAMFLLGLPIFMSLIISSVVAILAGGDILPLSVIHNSLFDGLNLFPLLAIPCFVVAGTLMEFGNITQQIVDVVKQLVGRVYGGLGITTILACTFFAAISGSGPGPSPPWAPSSSRRWSATAIPRITLRRRLLPGAPSAS